MNAIRLAALLRAIADRIDPPVPPSVSSILARTGSLTVHFQPEESPMSKITLPPVPLDCDHFELSGFSFVDHEGVGLASPPGDVAVAFEGNIKSATYDPATNTLKAVPVDDGKVDDTGKITLTRTNAVCEIDVLFGPPTPADIVANPATLNVVFRPPPA